MSKIVAASIGRLADQIVEYLAAHPHAADTMEGIQNWWLPGIPPGARRGDVETAIHVLVQRGVLECRTLADGTRVYARAAVRH